jgi:hypothetical protein
MARVLNSISAPDGTKIPVLVALVYKRLRNRSSSRYCGQVEGGSRSHQNRCNFHLRDIHALQIYLKTTEKINSGYNAACVSIIGDLVRECTCRIANFKGGLDRQGQQYGLHNHKYFSLWSV